MVAVLRIIKNSENCITLRIVVRRAQFSLDGARQQCLRKCRRCDGPAAVSDHRK